LTRRDLLRLGAAGTLALAFLAPATPAAAQDFLFRKGDRVVFLGDSITEQYQYSTAIELYLTMRFPDGTMTFINAGISGDTAGGGAGRFQKHVLAEKPTVVLIDFGMNDGGYGGFDANRAAGYVKNTEAMLAAAAKAGVRVGLVSPNAVEVRNKQDLATYLETQQKFYAPLKELAAKYQVPFVDQYAVTRKILEKLAADNAPVKPFPDAVHTNQAGGLLMAHTILTGLHAPAVVSTLELDAARPAEAVKAEHCTVKDAAAVNGSGLRFVRKDDALPLPVQKDWRPLLPYLNDLKDLNYQGLKVTGLKDGKYALKIDGQEVAQYEARELAAGVNLGNLDKGPQFDQAQKVYNAINAKNQLVHHRFRGVLMAQIPDWILPPAEAEKKRAEELQKLMGQIEQRQAEVYKLAQPAEHKYELTLVP
jgi:lysophospholipase L1-like esterase